MGDEDVGLIPEMNDSIPESDRNDEDEASPGGVCIHGKGREE